MHIHARKTLKPGLAKYAADANLFQLGSTNPKKKFPALGQFTQKFILRMKNSGVKNPWGEFSGSE